MVNLLYWEASLPLAADLVWFDANEMYTSMLKLFAGFFLSTSQGKRHSVTQATRRYAIISERLILSCSPRSNFGE